MQGIYKITNLQSKKIYIGLSHDMENRFLSHATDSTNIPLKRDISALGIDNFRFDVLELVEDPKLLNDRETYWIKLFKSNGVQLYNLQKNTESANYKRHTFYFDEYLIKAVAIKAAIEGRDKSEIIRAALYEYLEDEYLTFT